MILNILADGDPTAWGFDASGWVALSMIAVFAIMLWAKVPAIVGKMLDKQIAEIKKNLDEAANLRKEAEALKAEYEAKAAGAAQEAESMIANAQKEAEALVEQAKADTKTLITRRKKMAKEKIAAAERAAIAEVRENAANAASMAAEQLIISDHDAAADKALIENAIADLGQR